MAWDYSIRSLDLPKIRGMLRRIVEARKRRDFQTADALRNALLAIDRGMQLRLTREKASLWHHPNPPCTGYVHHANIDEFIANSQEPLDCLVTGGIVPIGD